MDDTQEGFEVSIDDVRKSVRRVNELDYEQAADVRFVLFDIDDTITKGGRLLESSYSALWRLEEAGLKAIPVTGRPAGWCDLIARQWPVDAVVGENGAFAFYLDNGKMTHLLHPEASDPETAQKRLVKVWERVFAEVPKARIAKDQFSRLFDLAIDFAEEEPLLPLETAILIREICESMGAQAKISSIHVNTWFGNYDKLSMAEILLANRYNYSPDCDRASVIYFGDSPNDEPMFRHFPLSVGVANVKHYLPLMKDPPAFITDASHGQGFAEGIEHLLGLRNLIANK
jgi:HAD superfamily hydrolase (TIGR01484 family)